jgi:hypothetical protein
LALAKHKIIVPWKSRPAPELGVTCVAYENPIRAYSDEILSKTDIDELYSALTIVKSLGFTQIRRLTHQDQAYIDAWKSDGGRRQYPMRYELLFDKPNESVATDIAFLSHHIH